MTNIVTRRCDSIDEILFSFAVKSLLKNGQLVRGFTTYCWLLTFGGKEEKKKKKQGREYNVIYYPSGEVLLAWISICTRSNNERFEKLHTYAGVERVKIILFYEINYFQRQERNISRLSYGIWHHDIYKKQNHKYSLYSISILFSIVILEVRCSRNTITKSNAVPLKHLYLDFER